MEKQSHLRAVPSDLTGDELLRWISQGLAASPVSPNNFAEVFTVIGELNGKSREFVIEAVTHEEGAGIALQLIHSYYSARNGIISREIWQKGDAHLRDSIGRKYPLYSNGLPRVSSGVPAPERPTSKRPRS